MSDAVDRLVIALARATGRTEAQIRVEFGIPRRPSDA